MSQTELHALSVVVLWMVIFNTFLIIYNTMQIYHNRKSVQIRERDEKINNLEQDLKASRATIIRMLHQYSKYSITTTAKSKDDKSRSDKSSAKTDF